MDRTLVFPGALPRSMDFLQFQKDAVYGLGYLGQAVLGTNTVVDGLVAAPTSPNTLNITVGAGSIYAVETMDATAYGVLGVDSNTLVKQGLLLSPVTLTITPPSTSGYSQVFLVEAAYEDVDGGSTVLPYYNSANPSVPYAGPANAGTSNYTIRQGQCVITLKAGTAAPTGSQTTPSPDVGYTGLYAVTVANGASSVTSGNIAALSTAPFITLKLPLVPAAIQAQAANYAVDSGSANTLAVTLPGYTSVAAGLTLRIKKSSSPNSGACTLNVNGTGARTVQWADGSALANGDWPANAVCDVVFDGSVWEVTSLPGPKVFARATSVIPVLAGAATYYVNASTGSDSNNGLTSGTAFATIQHALSIVAGYNLNGYTVTINVANGTYAATTLPFVNGSGAINLVGNTASPSSVVISSSSGSALTCANANGYSLNGFRFQSSGSSSSDPGAGVLAVGCSITLQNVAFGTCQGAIVSAENGAQIFMIGTLTLNGGTTSNSLINGAAFNAQYNAYIGSAFPVSLNLSIPSPITLAGPFIQATNTASTLLLFSSTTGGSNVTGSKYNANSNGVINTGGGGSSYYPGSTAGTTATGGQYI